VHEREIGFVLQRRPLPPKLFGLLGALTLAKADARAAAILVDELDASTL
jgi:hypothetical protein